MVERGDGADRQRVERSKPRVDHGGFRLVALEGFSYLVRGGLSKRPIKPTNVVEVRPALDALSGESTSGKLPNL